MYTFIKSSCCTDQVSKYSFMCELYLSKVRMEGGIEEEKTQKLDRKRREEMNNH